MLEISIKIIEKLLKMLDFELRAKKLQKESDSRLLEAKKKRERETKLLREQKLREDKLVEIAKMNRLKLEELENQRLERDRLLFERTGGIDFVVSDLIPYLIDGEDDKVILPESSLSKLTELNAFHNGTIFFELYNISTPAFVTHCGVREFSAAEGMIGLTSKLIESLLQSSVATVQDIKSITIRYVILQKINKAKFSPFSMDFYQLNQIKHVLEENLRLHSTLTIGDIFTVWYRGKSYKLQTTELSPQSYGTLVDTDVEVEFGTLSEPENDPTKQLSSTQSTDKTTSQSQTLDPTLSSSLSSRLNKDSAEVLEQGAFLLFDIPDEPASDGDDIIQIRLRLPTGLICSRRFLKYDNLWNLFLFASNMIKTNPNKLRIITPSNGRSFDLATENIKMMNFENGGFQKREMVIVTYI